MKKVRYNCGCCGLDFYSTPEVNRLFDQDEGYGICPSCFSEFKEYRNIFRQEFLLHTGCDFDKQVKLVSRLDELGYDKTLLKGE